MPARCSALTMSLNSLTWPSVTRAVARTRRRVALVRCEEADRVVAPVVGQALVGEEPLGNVLVHRQQFHRGHAEVAQVLRRGLVREARVGAANLRRDVRVAGGEALDVHLVQDGVHRPAVQLGVALPVVARLVDHQGPRHVRRGVDLGLAGTGRPGRGRAARGRRSPRRRWPWRRGRAAACSGCSAGRSPGRTAPSPGSRRPVPAGRQGRSRSTRRRRSRRARTWSPCPCHRRGTR